MRRLARPQFGDKPIMEYLSHKRALLPALANTYALQVAQRTLKVGRGGRRGAGGGGVRV